MFDEEANNNHPKLLFMSEKINPLQSGFMFEYLNL